MMFRFKLLVIVFFFPLLGLAQQRWQSIIERTGSDEISGCISQDYDKGYLLSGGFINEEGLIVKTSINGDKQWDKVFIDENKIIYFYAGSTNSSGRKILVGHTGSDPLIISLNPCGEVDWCYLFKNQENFVGGQFTDAILYEDGHALLLASMGNVEEEATVYLFYFDASGNLLWMNEYIGADEYPDLYYPAPFNLDTINSDYFVTGYCFYRLIGNPDVFARRPMYIKIDEDFIEEWLLPYGHHISTPEIIGFSQGVLKENDSVFKGNGDYSTSEGLNGLMMNFDSTGLETDFVGIPNHLINDSITDNYMRAQIKLNDSLYMTSTIIAFGSSNIHMGEYIVSRIGNIYGYQYHPNTTPAFHPMIKTDSSQIVFAGKIKQNEDWDMFLYKLNSDLSSADPVNDTITYDYLCDDLPIVSDTIDLTQCGIITGTGEIPTPEEYYASLSTIRVTIQPNPASERVSLRFQNTGDIGGQLHLKCYSTAGWLMFEQDVNSGKGEMELNVSSWQSGIYVVVVASDNGKQGSRKFVVE